MTAVDRELHECDVLVIGGGLAGCWAALRAKDFVDKVVLVDKGKVSRSGASVFAAGVMLCPAPEDDLDLWMKEIVESGKYLNDQEWVEVMLREQIDRVRDLESWGASFERDEKGNLVRIVGRGHVDTRVLVFHGKQFMETMRRQVLKKGIPIVERVMITDLLTGDGKHPTRSRVVGASGFDTRSGKAHLFKAKATVLATGGIGFKGQFFTDNITGDGLAQAFRAGAEVSNMEFCGGGGGWCFERKYLTMGGNLWQEAGVIITNAKGEEFMQKYFPGLKQRAQTSELHFAFQKEGTEGRGPIYADMTHFDAKTIERFRRAIPLFMHALDRAGIDLTKQKLVFDLPSSFGGGCPSGVRINIYGETSLPGLYAAGKNSGYPAHGTYSVGGVNLAMCCVGGHRAGEYAARYASEIETAGMDDAQARSFQADAFGPLQVKDGLRPDALGEMIVGLVNPVGVAFFRHANRIERALSDLERLKSMLPQLSASDIHELVKANEVKGYLQCVELALRAMLERKESRSDHQREDYPYRDDFNWLRWVVLYRDDNGIVIRHVPIPIYRYPVRPESYQRLPSDMPIPQIED